MKKIFKSRLFFLLLGVLISTVSTVLAYSYFAQEVGFTPTDNSWQDVELNNIDNVSSALDNLYQRINKMNYKEIYSYSPGSPANFSYTFETDTKDVLVILSSIYSIYNNESDSTITVPDGAVELLNFGTTEYLSGRLAGAHSFVYYIKKASGTVSGRISYRGTIKIYQIN